MTTTVRSIGLFGVEPIPVIVTATRGRSPGDIEIVGLPEAAARETRIRVRSAITELDLELPSDKVIVEIAATCNPRPPSLGAPSAFDLPVLIAVLGEIGAIDIANDRLENTWAIGQLSFTGVIEPTRGLHARLSKALLPIGDEVIVPAACGAEAGYAMIGTPPGVRLYGVQQVSDIIALFEGTEDDAMRACHIPIHGDLPAPFAGAETEEVLDPYSLEMLTLAAAGGFNILFVGPHGGMRYARVLQEILPPLTTSARRIGYDIHSASGILGSHETAFYGGRPPLRAPHHTVSEAGLCGGGVNSTGPRPGEVSLAHGGVLLLEEVNEYRLTTIDRFSGILRRGEIVIHPSDDRLRATSIPALPTVTIATAAPCPDPKHYSASRTQSCDCSPARLAGWRKSIPVEMFDLVVHTRAPALADVISFDSEKIRERIANAWALIGPPDRPPAELRAHLRTKNPIERVLAALDGELLPTEEHIRKANEIRNTGAL